LKRTLTRGPVLRPSRASRPFKYSFIQYELRLCIYRRPPPPFVVQYRENYTKREVYFPSL
jgi:hypothetical protein